VQLGFLIIAICETKGSSLGASPVNLESPLDTQPARVSFNAESPHHRTTAPPHHRTTASPHHRYPCRICSSRRSTTRTPERTRRKNPIIWEGLNCFSLSTATKRRRARAQLSISKVTFPPVSWTSALFTEFFPSSLCQGGL
jgi:hypothetical protein